VASFAVVDDLGKQIARLPMQTRGGAQLTANIYKAMLQFLLQQKFRLPKLPKSKLAKPR